MTYQVNSLPHKATAKQLAEKGFLTQEYNRRLFLSQCPFLAEKTCKDKLSKVEWLYINNSTYGAIANEKPQKRTTFRA